MRRSEIRAELRRRAEFHLRQTHLTVDYYRIRRRLAHPLPLRKLPLTRMDAPGIPNYPWATWLSWELEERINALGWAGHWLRRKTYRELSQKDLTALAEWPRYRPGANLDLCQAHTARTLCNALRQWPWLGEKLRRRIQRALARIVDDGLPLAQAHLGRFQTKERILEEKEPHWIMRNIPIIAIAALAAAANVTEHRAAAKLNRWLLMAVEAMFVLRAKGHTEGVAYDGYILDFLADWLASLPAKQRESLLDRPEWKSFLNESFMLAAPGAMAQVAELHDVEPRRMPFHISAHAKLHAMRSNATAAWHLKRCRIDWLRADALGTLHDLANRFHGKAPEPGALDAQYASVLRTGWESEDVAVVVGASNAVPHVHRANGSVLIGTRRHWFVTLPGYQQYMPNSEREFTLGITAQNAPVINGRAQTAKAAQRLALESGKHGVYRTQLDLTRCYSARSALNRVVRTVWLVERRFIVIADQIAGRAVRSVDYYWHGHADAAWWAQDGWAKLYLAETPLWIHSPQAAISETDVHRLRGSRGQLTLCAKALPARGTIWWIFAFSATAPVVKLAANARSLAVSRFRFEI